MKWKMQMNINAVRRLFDWTPTAVDAPVARYTFYKDKGKYFLGYEVRVSYKYHDARTYFFTCDDHKLGLFPRIMALKTARRFWHKTRAQVEKQQCR